MNLGNFARRPVRTKTPQESQRKCKRSIKRDANGRVIKEEFVGCSKDEIKMMRESSMDDF